MGVEQACPAESCGVFKLLATGRRHLRVVVGQQGREIVRQAAAEFQSAGSIISYAWLQQFDLPTDGSADFTDGDQDGFNNWQEWRCLTDPTNSLSFLHLLPPAPAGADVTVSWPSGAGRSYVLECSTNLGATPPFLPLAAHLPGQPGTTSFTHTNGAGLGPCFYCVGAE